MTNSKRLWILIAGLTYPGASAFAADLTRDQCTMLERMYSCINAQYSNLTADELADGWRAVCDMCLGTQYGTAYLDQCKEDRDSLTLVANCKLGGSYGSLSWCKNKLCPTSGGGDEGGSGGGAGSGESCGAYKTMNGEYYEESADTCYVPSTEYFFTSQGHKYHFKNNCWWSS